MSLALAYTVHSVNVEVADFGTTINGEPVTARVNRLVIELTADDGDHGHTFRLPIVSDAGLAALREEFAVGAKIILTLGAPS